MFLLALVCGAQEPGVRPGTPATEPPPRPLRLPVLSLDAVSVYGEGDLYRMSDYGGTVSQPSLRMFASGVTGDLSAGFGTRTQFTAGYTGGYIYNSRYSVLNGASHTAWFELRTDPARRTLFTLGARGESGLISDALFDPSYLLTVASRVGSTDELLDGVVNAGADSQLDSAVDLALSAGRRRAGAAYASLSHAVSRRFTASLRMGAMRELHSYSREEQLATRYPNATVGMGDLSLAFSLSPRTRIRGIAGYTRTTSRGYHSEWETGGLGVERQFSRNSFGLLEAGYSRMTDAATVDFGTSSYMVFAAYGRTHGAHTLALLCRRGLGDVHGLGAQSTTECSAAWSRAPLASGWTMGSSVGYQRFSGGSLDALQSWVAQASLLRQVGPHFGLSFTAVYLSHTVPALADVARAGLRVALVWRPAPERRR